MRILIALPMALFFRGTVAAQGPTRVMLFRQTLRSRVRILQVFMRESPKSVTMGPSAALILRSRNHFRQ